MKTLILAALLAQELLRAQTGEGVVTGNIRGLNGAPAAGVRVAALEASAPDSVVSPVSLLASLTQTDSDGRYRLEGIPPGRYYIVAGAVDFPTFFPGVPSSARATALTITRGVSLDGVDFRLAASGFLRVSGKVIGDRDSTVYVSLSGPEELYSDVAPDGHFMFPGVRPADYTLRVIAGNAAPTGNIQMRRVTLSTGGGVRIVPEGSLVLSSMPIVVDDKDIAGLELNVSTVVLTGRVDVEDEGPLLFLDLSLTGISGPANALSISQDVRLSLASNGAFSTILPEGEYRITAKATPDVYRVDALTSGSVDLLRESLKVSRGSPPRLGVKLAVTKPPLWVNVRGRVTGVEYLPRQTEPRVVFSGGIVPSSFEAPITADGSFSLPRVLTGIYTLTTVPATEYSRNQEVVLEGNNIEPVLVEIPVQKQVAGRIVVEGGGPVPRLLLSFTSVKWGRNSRVPVEPGGIFTITLPEGENLVRPFEPARDDYEIKTVVSGSTNLLEAPLLIASTDPQEIVVTVGLMHSVRVAGRVISASTLPTGARVKLAGDASLDLETLLSPDGSFEFPKVLPGTYILETVPPIPGARIPAIDVAYKDLNAIEFVVP